MVLRRSRNCSVELPLDNLQQNVTISMSTASGVPILEYATTLGIPFYQLNSDGDSLVHHITHGGAFMIRSLVRQSSKSSFGTSYYPLQHTCKGHRIHTMYFESFHSPYHQSISWRANPSSTNQQGRTRLSPRLHKAYTDVPKAGTKPAHRKSGNSLTPAQSTKSPFKTPLFPLERSFADEASLRACKIKSSTTLPTPTSRMLSTPCREDFRRTRPVNSLKNPEKPRLSCIRI